MTPAAIPPCMTTVDPVSLSEDSGQWPDQPWTSVCRTMKGWPSMLNRPALSAAVLSAVMLATFGVSPAVAGTAHSGEVGWVTDVGGGAVSAPTAGKDLVYAGTGDGWLSALDPDTGQIVWVTSLDGVIGGAGAVSTPTLGKDFVYAGTASGHLAALG